MITTKYNSKVDHMEKQEKKRKEKKTNLVSSFIEKSINNQELMAKHLA